MDLNAASSLHQLIYDATTRNIPNLGGTHGFNMSPASNPEQLLRASSAFVGSVRAGKVPPHDQIESFRAECLVAAATGLLADSDMEKINQILDKIKDE